MKKEKYKMQIPGNARDAINRIREVLNSPADELKGIFDHSYKLGKIDAIVKIHDNNIKGPECTSPITQSDT